MSRNEARDSARRGRKPTVVMEREAGIEPATSSLGNFRTSYAGWTTNEQQRCFSPVFMLVLGVAPILVLTPVHETWCANEQESSSFVDVFVDDFGDADIQFFSLDVSPRFPCLTP